MPAFNQDPISRSRGVRSSARAHLARLREDRLQKRLAALPAATAGHTPAQPASLHNPAPRHAPATMPAASTDTSHAPDAGPASMPTSVLADAPETTLAGPGDRDTATDAAEHSESIGMTIGGAPSHPVDNASVEKTDARHDPSSEEHGFGAIRPAGFALPADRAETKAEGSQPTFASEPLATPSLTPVDCIEEMPPQPDADASPEASNGVSETRPAEPPPAEAAAPAILAQSDLADLPGAGPGLVWLLQECGVSSMAELATVDATELAGKLGLVGQLLDLNHWIAHARARS